MLAFLSAQIVLADPPTGVSFTISDTTPTRGQDVQFDADTASDPDAGGTITSYEWDFGDGATGSGQNVSHSYTSLGQQTVRLTVTDSASETTVVTDTLQVVNAIPTASFSCSPSTLQPGQATTCNGSASDDPEGGALTYEWDSDGDGFDDGNGSSAQFSYPSAGTKTITLRVSDPDGGTDTAQRTVRVNAAPTASFSCSPTVFTPSQSTTCTSSSTDDQGGLSFEWDKDGNGFNDGTSASQQLTFPTAGTKTITLRVTDSDGASATTTRTVRVNAPPTAEFSCSPTTVAPNEATSCNGSASSDTEGPVSFAWDIDGDGFDDGSDPSESFSFGTPGTKTIRLQVRDSDNATHVTQRNITVNNAAPTARFTFSPANPTVGQQVSFNGTTSSDPENDALTYAWDFDGDGFDDGTASTATHTFSSGGNKTVRLRVRDTASNEHIATEIVSVGNAAPVARITFSPPNPNGATEITFDGSTSSDAEGQISAYAWDVDNDGAFDDGTGATKRHTFFSSGSKTVRLQVTDSGGLTDTEQVTLTVANAGPTARFTFSPASPTVGEQVSFNGSTSSDPEGDNLAYEWDFDGDGFDDGTGQNITHSFSSGGNKSVRLRVRDAASNEHIATEIVPVSNALPTARITFSPPNPNGGTAITFDGSTSSDPEGLISAYAWDIDNDGQFDDGNGATKVHTFGSGGSKTVRLRVTDSANATDTEQVTLTIANSAPTARFTFSPASPNVGQQVSFNANTSSDPEGDALTYAWDFDNDGQFDDGTGVSPNHTFTSGGNKSVRLRVSDPGGLNNTTTEIVPVANALPTARITFNPTNPNGGTAITFDGSTSSDPEGQISAYAWDIDNDGAFDDGNGATKVHTFGSGGSKTVRLQVTDAGGATDTEQVTVTVVNSGPTARFTFSPATPDVGQQVGFNATTSSDPENDTLTYAWDFDNDGFDNNDGGNADTGPTPTHTFTSGGNRPVSVRVTDPSGLNHTVTHNVPVNNAAPTARITFSPSTPNGGTAITFDGSTSSDPEGSISAYAWDIDNDGAFDDGNGATKVHTFNSGGTKTVKLRVTDSNTATNVATTTVPIANSAPTARFSSSPASPGVGDAVSFNGNTPANPSSDPEGDSLTYAWDFDNDGFDNNDGGNADTGPTPTHSFASAGNKPVSLRVTDPGGLQNTITQNVSITNAAPTAIFAFSGTNTITPNVPDVNEPINFASASTDPDGNGDIKTFQWDFDYIGTTFTVDRAVDVAGIQHSYSTSGTRRVALRVIDNSGAMSNPVAVQNVRVNDLPVARINVLNGTAEPGQKNNVPLAGQAFAFTAQEIPELPGAAPAPGCDPAPPSPLSPGTTDPDNATDGNSTEITKYEWDLNNDGTFGDATGLPATSPNAPSSGFPAGPRTVGLRVTDSDQATATTTREFRVNAPPSPQFNIEPLTPIVGQEITFSSSLSGDPDAADNGRLTFVWDLNDNGQFCEAGETGPSAKWTFTSANPDPGHPVRMRVTDTGGITREVTRPVKVQNTIPSGRFTWSPSSPLPGQTVTFDGGLSAATAGKTITKYEWDFDFDPMRDDFNPADVDATGASVSRSFPTAGNKTIGLKVSESGGGFAIVFDDRFVVNAPPSANFSMSDESPFAGDAVTISSTAADPDGPLAAQSWDFDNDGEFDDAAGPVVTATFARTGSYTLRLRVTDSKGATATAFKQITVRQRPVPPPELLPGVLVEIKGSILGRDTRVKRLLVRAPAGSKVTVLCRGKSCPKATKKKQTKMVRSGGVVRFKKLERKLRAGTKIIVQVTRSGFIGRQTTFTLRRGTAPKRVDLCLPPGAKKAVACGG